jgi:lipopolysaccharide export system protein LptA
MRSFPLSLVFMSISTFTLLLATEAYSQSRVQILNADHLEGFSGESGTGRMLAGNVHLKVDNTFIEADTVYQYLDLDEIRAFGNIQVTTPTQRIWSDKAVYNYVIDESNFENRVVIVTENVSIFSSQAYYSFFNEIALFPNRLKLEDERGLLFADSGEYYAKQDSAVFRGNVQFADSTQYVEADSMFSNRVSEYYELHGRVFLLDVENRTRLTGNYVERDSMGRRLLQGDARLIRINEDATDSTFMHADVIEMTELDSTYVTQAEGDVRIWSPRYSTRSDSSRYIDDEEYFFLWGNGNIWYDDTQLTGQQIIIRFLYENLESIDSTERPFAVLQDTLTGRLNQLKGDSISVFFVDGNLTSLTGRPNARIFYHMKTQENEPDGGIEMTSESAVFYFEDGDLSDFKAFTNIEGTVHPESPEVLSLHLEGMIWTPERRPERPSSTIRQRLEPIPDEPLFKLPDRFIEYLSGR